MPQLMAPPSASTQAPVIQPPPLNQVTQTPQGYSGHAFIMNVNQAQNSSDVVNGTFLIGNHYASVLFDSGANKSFISLDFAYIIDKPRDKLSKPFTIEVADGNFIIIIDLVVRDCIITINKVKFFIDLIPMQMGSFDVILGVDWLTFNRAEVVSFKKFIHIPLEDGRILNIFGDTPTSKLNIMSCFQAQRYLRKKCDAFLALVVEKE
ncbi:uncharacterized protein LOC143635541 [Bidens hawaiensis]|uniref:uncharacterized protein LOC143635541 n=1 Tax=Bidens hawaiensis TaxID=980011 RepID=UPI00404A82B8